MSELLARLQAALSGRYTLKRELGRGGMAVVFLAEDLRLHRQVAIKLFLPELAGTVGHERFLREIQVAANLTHPHILPLFESGEADGLLYYVMPLVQGETLRERLRRSGQLPLSEAVRIAGEIADALAYAHRNGVVHRDIKPENVMLTGGHALVMDFGICRAVGEASNEDSLTRVGLTLGTPAYMSPEQWSAPDRVAEPSDIYSLGCVLYEMLVGEPPFTGTNMAVIMARHTQQEAPSVRVVRPDVNEGVELILRRALAKLPEERFDSADQFGETLQSAITMPFISIPAPIPLRTRLRSPRMILVATIVAILVAGASYFAYGIVTAGDDRVRLLVLPFRNMGAPDPFADGLSEEVTNRLTSISGLAVIASTSAMQYKQTKKTTKEIGKELDVSYMIQGSVRCDCSSQKSSSSQGGRLTVNVSLIKATEQTPVWTQKYDETLTDAGAVFEIQSSIARRVATVLRVTPGEREDKRLAATPTKNLDAYDLYLQGNDHYNRSWQRGDVETALQMYQEAVSLDPQFALAHAQLARTRAWLYRLGFDTTTASLAVAKQEAETAVRLDPDLPEAHVALGLYHYWGRFDYPAAAREFVIARRLNPGNPLVHQNFGNIQRRTGQWADAIRSFREAANLDPLYYLPWHLLGETSMFIRDYDAAASYLERARRMNPDHLEGYFERAKLTFERGDLAGARRIIQQAMLRIPPTEWRPTRGVWLLGLGSIVFEEMSPAVQLAPGIFGLDSALYYLVRGRDLQLTSQPQRAHAAFDSARVILERTPAGPSRSNYTDSELAIAYAGLGRKDDAIRAGLRGAALLARDKFDGADMVAILARVYLMVGDHELALDNLEQALDMPSRLSRRIVRMDPFWSPLSKNPRFQQLIRDDVRAPVVVLGPTVTSPVLLAGK